MQERSSSKRAFTYAFWTCILLLAAFATLVTQVGFGSIDVTMLFQGAALLSIALVSVIVYQTIRISATANTIAQGMAKDMLLYSRELFSELYRSSPVPYILIDQNGTVESTNYAAVRLFHIEEGDFDGGNIFDRITGSDVDRVALIPEKLKQGLFVNEEDVEIVRPDGTHRNVLLSLFSFMDTKGVRKGLLTLVDITKQKQVDKAKTEFVSLASHQLRTPISALKWNVELLHSANPEVFTPLQQEYLLKIARGLGRMDELIEDFLNVSKFELGTLATKMEQVELGGLVASLREEVSERARVHHITIEEEWSEQPLTLRSDAHLLSMIIGNLLSNAVKYTKDGGVVGLRIYREATQLTVAVSDTGIGIPKDEHEQIFTKIFRASNARAQVGEGTGLGLYIVHEAVKVLGGTITFESTEGVGTTFTVLLPILE